MRDSFHWKWRTRSFLEGRAIGRGPKVTFYAAQNYTTPQIPGSDSEIAADLLVVEHMRLLGRLAHLFDRDRIEIGEKGFARPAYRRIDHALEQHRVCAEIVRIRCAQRHRGAYDLAHGDPPVLARQLIAASRPAHALEDLGVDQALEQCLQGTRGQFVTRSQSFGRNRRRARMQRDIDYGGDSKNAPSRQQGHVLPPSM